MIYLRRLWHYLQQRRFAVAAAILLAILGIVLTSLQLQNDTFYTIKVGEHIMRHGVDGIDPFSFHHIAYTYPHWLYDCVVYLIYHWFGFIGLYISTCLLSAVLGITIFFITGKLCRNQLAALATSAVSLFLLNGFLTVRAQLVTYILLILAVYCIEQFLASQRKHYVAGLIIIPWLIANLHAAIFPFYFVLFLPYLADYMIGRTIAHSQRDKTKLTTTYQLGDRLIVGYNPATRRLPIIMLLGLATGLLTPLGLTPYTYLPKTMLGTTTSYIAEHAPIMLANNFWLVLALIIVLGILIFSRIKFKLSDALMLFGLMMLTILSRRQLSLLALIGSIGVSRMVTQLINRTKLSTQLVQHKLGRPIMIIDSCLVIGIIAITCLTVNRIETKMINPAMYPTKAADFIIGHLDLTTTRLYNPYVTGGYLLYRNIPVFIDSRADLYTPEFNGNKDLDIFTDANNVETLSKQYYRDVFNKYHLTHALVNVDSPLDIILKGDGKYQELYRDQYFAIYKL